MNVREIAKSIAEELREHPERWCQGRPYQDANGNISSPISAHSCCLLGHIWLAGDDGDLERTFRAALPTFEYSIAHWNDAPDRTVEEVIQLCEKVAAGDAP